MHTVCCAGIGLTLGVAEIDSIIVLDTQKAVDAFTKNQVSTQPWRFFLLSESTQHCLLKLLKVRS